MLRRLLVVGLAWAFFCAPALARAGTVAIFYYPWYGTPAADGAWQHWDQNGHRPPSDLYSGFFPALGPYSSSDPAVVERQMTQIAVGGRRRGRRLVVGPRLRRGRAAAARRHGGAAARAARRASTSSRTRTAPRRPSRSTSATSPPSACATSTSTTRATFRRRTGRPRAPQVPVDDAASSPGPRRPASPPPAGSTASTPTTSSRTPARSSRAFARRRTRCTSLCAPSVGPGYDGHRAGEPPLGRPRQNGATYDLLWTAALAAHPDVVTITSFNEWGEGTQIEPAAGPARLRAATTAPGASWARRPRRRTSCGRRTGPPVFTAFASATVDLSRDGYPRCPRAAHAASERADARAARAHPGLRRAHGAGGRRAELAGRDPLRDRRRDRPDRRLPRAPLARRVALRQDRRPARRPADDRRRGHPARRLRPAAVGRASS